MRSSSTGQAVSKRVLRRRAAAGDSAPLKRVGQKGEASSCWVGGCGWEDEGLVVTLRRLGGRAVAVVEEGLVVVVVPGVKMKAVCEGG